MTFETKEEVLQWYEGQPRALADDFIASIPWHKVRDYPFDPRFIPVLFYMRDVETLTEMYHNELRRTPTGRDPVISKFMERWGIEEVTHGEVMNRFINELGIETGDEWQQEIHRAVSKSYHLNTYIVTTLTNLIGHKFTATHMTFGAVHEMTTAQAYRRMMELAGHPILTMILKAIIREESAHTQFYWSMARLELRKNSLSRSLARSVINRFYYPVGQGSLAKERTNYVVATLFEDDRAMEIFDTTVTRRVQSLPGFDEITKVTDTIANICETHGPQLRNGATLLAS